MSVVKTFRLALAYAKFENQDVKNGLTKLVDEYDRDMEEVQYEPSEATQKAEKDLQEIMNEADQESEAVQEMKEAGAGSSEDDNTEV